MNEDITMMLAFWVLWVPVYIALICLLARVLGFNELDGETDPAAADSTDGAGIEQT
jgi:hypothetical protein